MKLIQEDALKTRDRKLKVADTIYVFRVPADTSLDPMDIIKVGRIKMIRIGIMSIKDVFGNPLGNSARSWNSIKETEIEQNGQINDLIVAAIQRTRNLIESEIKHPNTTILPKLAIFKHRGEIIQRWDEEPQFYYITAKSFCANCCEPIYGIQRLEINSNGKVHKELPFEPVGGTAVPHLSKKGKWLHNACNVTPVCISGIDSSFDLLSAKKTDTGKLQTSSEPDKSIDAVMLSILTDQDCYSADFARGAAYMFQLFNRIEK